MSVLRIFNCKKLCIVFFILCSSGCETVNVQAIDVVNKYLDINTEITDNLPPQKTANEKRNFDQPILSELPLQNSGLLTDVDLSGNNRTELGIADKNKKGQETQFVELEFKDVSLEELIHLFFKEYLKKPYTILDDYKDKNVNFVFNGYVSKDDLIKVFEVFFGFHGVLLRSSRGVYAVSSNSANITNVATLGGAGDTIAIFKCRYIDSRDFVLVARMFLANPKSAINQNNLNTVVVKASQNEIDAIDGILKQIDTPYFNGKSLLIYAPKYLDIQALKVLIEQYEHMLGSNSKHPKKRIEVDSLVDENRLVMVASHLEAKQLLLQFINSVDHPGISKRQLFQYPLSNQVAADVLETVKNLFKSVSEAGETIEVIPDMLTNSLFIMASPEDYVELKKLLRVLDYRIPAVHIDVLVAEVVLKDRLQYGVEWFLTSRSGNTVGDIGLDLSDAALLASGAGATMGIISLSDDKFVSVQMLAQEGNFTVLSNPHLLVKNGASAMINVGQDVPIPTSTTTTNNAGQSSQTDFQRHDVTIKLEVTPRISMEGVIQLEVKLKEIRQAGFELTGDSRQPIFSVRELDTNLVLEDNQTVLLGGIIQRNVTEETRKWPILGDIPYLGVFFSSADNKEESTELFMLITPRLVLDGNAAESLTKALINAKNVIEKKTPIDLFPELNL